MLDKLPLTKVVWIIAGLGLALSMFFAAKDVWRNLVIEQEMEQSGHVVELSVALSAMVHEQQKERGASAVFCLAMGRHLDPNWPINESVSMRALTKRESGLRLLKTSYQTQNLSSS